MSHRQIASEAGENPGFGPGLFLTVINMLDLHQGSEGDTNQSPPPAPPTSLPLTITGRTAVTPSREGALCRGTGPGLAADTTLPAETDVAPGSGRREALPAGELLPLVPAA